jgi:hypothetical protein
MLKHSAAQLQNHIRRASERAITSSAHRPNAYQRAIDLKQPIDADYVTSFLFSELPSVMSQRS